jgi:preprotein translocase subunit YajC
MFEVLALMPPAPAGTDPNPTGSMLSTVGMLVIMGVMFWFLLIRPQQKQKKEQENLLKNLKSGDKVMLSSGILGIVASVKDKTVTVKIADNVKIEVIKSSVSTVLQRSGEEEAKTETK